MRNLQRVRKMGYFAFCDSKKCSVELCAPYGEVVEFYILKNLGPVGLATRHYCTDCGEALEKEKNDE